MSPFPRILRTLTLAIALAAIPTVAASLPAAATTTSCSVVWGSLAKSSAPITTQHLTNVRSGQHTCYDRVVLDLGGRPDHPVGYSVKYVTNVYTDASGKLVPLAGGAKLRIVVNAPAYDVDTGAATYTPRDRTQLVDVTGYRTLRQVAWAGSFEGKTTIGVGVRARLPMRVFVMGGPGTGQRLVVDVAHHW